MSIYRHLRTVRDRWAGFRSRARDERGFTLVEITVAMGVILTSITMFGSVVTNGLRTTGVARQRQAATGFANQTLEQIRGLSYTTLQKGLDDTDLASTAGTTDPNITTTGCGGAYCFGGEPIQHSVTAAVDPLVPHMKTVTAGPTTYGVSSYVTLYKGTTDTYRVTVNVTWTGNLVGVATKKIQVQTVVYSPSGTGGCLSLQTHPFSGPCQPSFTSSSNANAGSVNITGTLGGITLDHATLWTARESSDGNIEQISRVEGLSQASGANLLVAGGTESSVGRQTVSSQAENDPASPLGIYNTQSQGTQAAASTTAAAGLASLTLATTGGDTGTTTSTTSACNAACTPATPVRYCPNLTGLTNDNDLQPCGGSSSRTASTITATTSHSNLGSFTLASIGAQSTSATSTFDRTASAINDGKVRATVTRPAVDMKVASLPSGTLAPTFVLNGGYFLKLTGYTDSVTTEVGISSAAPTASQSLTSLTYVGAGGVLVTKLLSELAVPLTIPALNVSGTVNGASVSITLDATVTPGSTPSDQGGCSGICTRNTASQKSIPPTIVVHYQITTTTNVQNITYTVDPGTLTAKATYAPVPV